MQADTFDWLKEYGPHWQPGSLAFWMAPETPEEMLSWIAKYRPELLPKPSPIDQMSQLYAAQGMGGSASHVSALNAYQQQMNSIHSQSLGYGAMQSALGRLF